MSREQVITLFLILVIIVLLHYLNKINKLFLKEEFISILILIKPTEELLAKNPW